MPAAPSAGRGSATITRVPSPLGSRGERPSNGTASASARAGGGAAAAEQHDRDDAATGDEQPPRDREPLARGYARSAAAAATRRAAGPAGRRVRLRPSAATAQAARRRPVA